MRRLHQSLRKFGAVYDGIANKDFSVIDGHSRLEINNNPEAMLRYFVPSRQLTEKEYKEMNAIFDIAKAGDTDQQMLEETFDDEFFEEWDLDKKRARLIEENKNATYPIVPEYDESYDAVIIICNTTTELSFIRNALKLGKEQSYKNKTVGESCVLAAKNFIKLWQSKSK